MIFIEQILKDTLATNLTKAKLYIYIQDLYQVVHPYYLVVAAGNMISAL